MNLQPHLLKHIAGVAAGCLLVLAALLLHQSHTQAAQNSQRMADAAGKQLEAQWLLRIAGIGRSTVFPDFEFWKQSARQPGVCLTYAASDEAPPRSICNGMPLIDAAWPAWFEATYRWACKPGAPVLRALTIQGRQYGLLTVIPSAELEIAAAWQQTSNLMALSALTVCAVCLWVYLTINRALQPAQTIVKGLAELEAGQLRYRLPPFPLHEWQTIGAAINQLAASQQQLLAERQTLLIKMINLQEQERRDLARELHDEFGQCLAAISAVATSIKQTAAMQAPDLLDDAERISQIAQHILAGVRALLGRLRPAELDELGLAASLHSLIGGWNRATGDKTCYQLQITGDCDRLSEAQALTVFRIVQECLTNIAKHAVASQVKVMLSIEPCTARVTVADDGLANRLPLPPSAGIGLLGIRERVTALEGKLNLTLAEPHGLMVEAVLPLAADADAV